MTARRELKLMMQAHPELILNHYSPGDGYTRYRIQKNDTPNHDHDYFSGSELFTGTARECVVYLYGYRQGKSQQ